MVMLVLALIALGFGTVLFVIDNNLTETRRILGETRCFYANDSASRLASAAVEAVVVQEPPGTTPATSDADALAAVCSIAGGCTGAPPLPVGIMPPGVTMTQFSATATPTTGVRMPSAGPLRGVIIKDSGMSIYIEGTDDGTGRDCHVRDTFFTGTIAAFEMMMFAAGDAMFYTHQSRSSPTPVYASGDLCIAAYGGKTFDMPRVGAGDDLHTPGGGTARHRRHRPRRRAGIVCPAPNGGSGPATVAGAPYVQPDYVSSFDQANVLTLPIGTTTPTMQGDNATDALSARWLVDPVVGDAAPIRKLKLADLADIRIIDGVWFLRQPGGSWPGIAIWSDHMGPGDASSPVTFSSGAAGTLFGGMRVNSDDIHANLVAAGLLPSSAPWPPKRYSFYEVDVATKHLLDGGAASAGVVSYGGLKNTAANRWVPGGWSAGAPPAFAAFSTFADPAAGLLESARTGFHDANAADKASGGNAAAEERILPINFDVAAFTQALADTTPGELGSYFTGGRRFNGIVWISQTWDGQLTGLGGGGGGGGGCGGGGGGFGGGGGGGASFTATLNPPQGAPVTVPAAVQGDAPLPAGAVSFAGLQTVGANANWALPHPLCSSMGIARGSTMALATGFKTVGCDVSGPPGSAEAVAYGNGEQGSVPNAVRVYNGANLVPLGQLTVATNLPLYVMGDWNAVTSSPGAAYPRSMLAGDTVTALSPTWDDGLAPWMLAPIPGAAPLAGGHSVTDDDGATVIGAGQIIRAGFIVGRTPAANRPPNQDLESLLRVLEQYSSAAPLVVRGAMMLGHTAVFRDDFDDTTYALLPTLDFKYDATLSSPDMQPPGTPRYLAGVTGKWKDSR